jgi:hypothetical protein
MRVYSKEENPNKHGMTTLRLRYLVLGQVVVLEVGQHAPQALPVRLILRHAHDAAPLPAVQYSW